MANIQAGEEDDEGFGDFKFVSSTTTAMTMSPNPAAASNRISDDYWNDFVSFNGLPQIKSNPQPPNFENSVEPFALFADSATAQRSARSVEMAPTGAMPEKPKWVKPSGAIPLSLFGEEEVEEEGSGVADSSFNSASGLFNHSNGDPEKKAPNLSSAVGLNDLIASLYNQNQHLSLPSDGSGVHLTLNGGELQELDGGTGLEGELHPKPLSNGFVIKMSNGNQGENEEDEWEFRAADAETRIEGDNSKGDQGKGEIGSDLNFNNSFSSWNDFSSDLNSFTSNTYGLETVTNGFNLAGVEKQEDVDDDFGWEFKGAEIENKLKEGNPKAEGHTRELLEEVEPNFEFGNLVQEPSGVMVALSKNSEIFGLDFANDVNSKHVSKPSFPMDSNPLSNGKEVKVNQDPVFGSFGFDDVWEFKEAASEIGPSGQVEHVVVKNGTEVTSLGLTDAVLQTGLPSEEHPDVVSNTFLAPANGTAESTDNFWEFKDAFADSNLEAERNGESQGNGKEAFSHSTFSDGNFENNGSLIYPNMPANKPPNDTSRVRQQSSNMSINDLISNLYDQAAPIASVPDVQVSGKIGFGTSKATWKQEPENEPDDFDDSWHFKAAETETKDASQISGNLIQQLSDNKLHSDQSRQECKLMISVDVSDDSSWDSKDSSSGLGYGDQVSISSFAEPHQKFSVNIEIDHLLEFYTKLKDELCLVALPHLSRMKEAHGLVGLPSEDATLEAQSKEIQELCNGLNPDNSISKGPSIDLPMRVANLKGFLPVLDEKFQAFEAEYQLSKKLLLVEEDPQTLIVLLRHVSSMLRVLRWGTVEERSRYISTWSKLISLCSQELKHGAILWKQALEKDVQDQLLSKSQGKNYILALGEIYRAVGVLGASIKLCKPWILISSADYSATSDLLKECSLVWSSSGLEEALRSMSDPLEFPYEGSVTALLESINDVHGLDEHALQTCNFAQEGRICRMSLLSAGSLQGMKMIEWSGKEYFVKLANLWSNLVSCDPPDLPRIEIS